MTEQLHDDATQTSDAAGRDRSVLDEIVVALTGGVHDQATLAHATALAAPAGLPVIVIHQVPVHPTTGLVAAAREHLDRLVSGDAAVAGVSLIESERPADAILDFLSSRPRAQLWMPTHARHAVGQLFLGSVAFEVARRSPIPMVVLGPDVSMPDDRAPLDEILVCLDGSRAGERALGPAATMARTFGLVLALGEVRRPDVVTVSGDVTEDAYLARVAQSADPPIDRWDVVADTRPADGIAELATGRPGAVLALATHARKVGERFREGSVAVDVIRAATAPVLIVGPRCRAGVR